MGFLTIVSLILIIAKCLGLIALSWLACFIPFIIGAVLGLIIIVISFLIVLFASKD